MRQSLILWISAAVITFLVGFVQTRTSPTYPISGTVGIEGKTVSYFFKKIFRDKDNYVFLLRTDTENLKGILQSKIIGKNQVWQIDTMKYLNGNLSVTIPKQKALTEIEYRIILTGSSGKYFLPNGTIEKLLFLDPVPLSIDIHYYLTLFIGILLAIRAGLETLNNKPRLRLFSIFTLISFFSCAMIFAPVKKAYEMGAIGNNVPPIGKLFELWLVALVIIWIMNLVLVSFSRTPKKWILLFSALTLVVFYSQNFF